MSNAKIESLADVIRVHGAGRSSHPCLIEGDVSFTWGEVYERAQRVANGLKAAGVGPHDRVVFLEKNSIAHFELAFGAALLNAVSVDVNWRLAPPEVEYIVNNAEAKVLVVGQDFVPVAEAIADKLTTVTTILVIGGHPKYADWNEWLLSQKAGDPGEVQSLDDISFQLYSSGTTGLPKGVLLDNNNLLALAPMIKSIWDLDENSINMAAMPLFHIGGGGWAMAGMMQGCTTIIVREMNPAAVLDLIVEKRITHAFLVPAVLAFMNIIPGAEDKDYSSLQVLVYGASPISEAVLTKSVEMFKCKFWQAYGLTETTGGVINLSPADHDLNSPNKHRLRSCGTPGPGVEIRIVNNDTNTDCATGEVGEIWIRSAQVMAGYWKNPEETAKAITPDKWFKSGDAGYIDADGYVYIHDRVKDMIVSGGENVYPAEVENVLMSHPGIADVAVIGIPHEKWGETALAVVVRAPDTDATEQDIISFSHERLAKFKCPTQVAWIDVLPRNPSGKVLKKDLREPYWAGRERRVN
jgi:long-chain acyl-CoA synthetase